MKEMSIALPTTRLGSNGPIVGAQGLGCMGMSEFYGATDATQARETLARALDLGVSLFDTADMYGIGSNETFLGPFFRANRRRVVIATKFGYTRSIDRPDDWSVDNRPDFIRRAVEASLARLGIETIDLYYMHRRNPDIPIEDSVGAMAQLVSAGKVRWLGLCEVDAQELRAAHAVHPIAALQSEWSVFSRNIESAVVPAAAELGVALVPYAPLGRGLLTGAAFSGALADDDARRNFPRFSPSNRESNMQLAGEIERVATAHGWSAAQVALAWLYAQARRLGVDAVPIPGTRKRSRLEENLSAASMVLSESDMAVLDPLAANVKGVAI